jgi:HK97 family phage portal protein
LALRNRLAEYFPATFGAPLSASGNGKSAASKTAAPAPEQKGLVYGASFVPINASGGTTGVRLSTERAMLASVLCYAAITYRMQKISEAPLMVVDETAEGEPWIENHPLASLLAEPNADQEMADLIEETHVALDLTGMALWVKQEGRDRGLAPVARLQAFSGDEFTVSSAEGRIYGRFRVRTSAGFREYDADEVVFFRYPHPTDRWRGLSPTDVALSHLGLESELIASLKAGLRNTVVPGMTLAFPPTETLSKEQREEFKADLAAGYEQARNHGKSLVVGGGVTATQNKLGFEGLKGGDLWREVEGAVCLAYGIRPEILGALVGLENSPWSHMQTAHRLVYDTTIIPLWRRWERILTRQLLRPMDEDRSHLIRFDTSKVRALQDDQERNARISLLVRDVATRNQRRQIAGLEPMDDDPEFWDAVQERATGAVSGFGAEAKARMPRLRRKSNDHDEFWRSFDEKARGEEPSWRKAVADELDTDRATIAGLARETLRTAKKETDPEPDLDSIRELLKRTAEYLTGSALERWNERIRPLVQATGRRALERLVAELGVSFDLLQPGLLSYTEREAAWLVKEVTETTRDAIRQALASGLEGGESIAKLTARIQESGAFAPSRAELIARTETTRVTNGAQRESLSEYADESGARITKRWLSARDGRVRAEHAELDGEVRGIDEAFSNGLQAPGEPNCRCTMIHRVEE